MIGYTIRWARTLIKYRFPSASSFSFARGKLTFPNPPANPIQSAAVALDLFHPDPAIGTCLPLPSHGGLRSSPTDDFARGRWASGPRMRGERRPGSRWGETRSGVSLGAATPGSSWCWRRSPPPMTSAPGTPCWGSARTRSPSYASWARSPTTTPST